MVGGENMEVHTDGRFGGAVCFSTSPTFIKRGRGEGGDMEEDSGVVVQNHRVVWLRDQKLFETLHCQ